MVISNLVIGFFINMIDDSFSSDELDRIKYSLQSILWEAEKIIILSAFFLLLGYLEYFICSLVVFVSIRVFSGGYHAKSSWTCLLISFILFSSAILILPTFTLTEQNQLIISFISILLCVTLSPLLSQQLANYDYNKKTYHKKRVASILVTAFWIILFLLSPDSTTAIICLWIVFLQNSMLLFETVRRKVIKHEAKDD